MASTTEAQFRDESGEVRLEGTIGAPGATASNVLTADGAGGSSWAPAGGSSPTARAQYSGLGVSINDGASANLTWDTLAVGTALLDLTDPANPTVLTAGNYAVSVIFRPSDAMTAGGYYRADLELDEVNDDATLLQDSPAATAANTEPEQSLSLTYYIPAGGLINAIVHNHDGASTIHFGLFGIIQKLS